MWTVFILVGTLSVATHLVLLNALLLPQQVIELRDSFSLLRARSDRKARSARGGVGWFDVAVPILVLLGCIAMDYTVLSAFAKGYTASGSVLAATLAATPHLFEMFNEFLADFMADVLFVGFIPGGRSGIVVGGLVSLALNALEVGLVISEVIGLTAARR